MRLIAFSAMMLLDGQQEEHLTCKKNWVVGCWCGYLSGARCRFAYGPADPIAAHCLLLQEIQIGFGFTFLMPAHPGSPRQNPEGRKMVVVVVQWGQPNFGYGFGFGSETAYQWFLTRFRQCGLGQVLVMAICVNWFRYVTVAAIQQTYSPCAGCVIWSLSCFQWSYTERRHWGEELIHRATTLQAHTHTHTTVLRLCGICPGKPGWAGTRRNIHPLLSS